MICPSEESALHPVPNKDMEVPPPGPWERDPIWKQGLCRHDVKAQSSGWGPRPK